MPAGKAYTSVDELPEQFADFSREAKQAAMDAYNGAIADGVPTGRALALAQRAAQSIDQGEEAGVSSETPPALRREESGPSPAASRPQPRPAGSLAGALRGANRGPA